MISAIDKLLAIRNRLASGSVVLNGWSMLGETTVLETIARAGYDTVCTDYQHGLAPMARAADHVRAIEVGGAVPFARAPGVDTISIGKLLDAGYAGIICPMVNSVQDAEAFVAASRFPPAGIRSYGPVRAGVRDGAAYFDSFAPNIVRLAMIETRDGCDSLPGILAVDGIDGIYIGPSDLAISLGLPPRPDPVDEVMLTTMGAIARQAMAARKIAGIHTNHADYACKRIEDRFNFLTCGIDTRVLATGLQSIVSTIHR